MGQLAYTLWHTETGWSWRVLDFEGELVASGAELDEDLAAAAVAIILRGGDLGGRGREL